MQYYYVYITILEISLPTLAQAYSDGKKTKYSFFSQSKLKSAYQEFLFTFFMYVSFTYCEAALKRRNNQRNPFFLSFSLEKFFVLCRFLKKSPRRREWLQIGNPTVIKSFLFLNALVVGVRCALSREKVNFCVRADKR